MVKHLINKLGRGIKRGICIATAGLFLQGCPFPEPPQEYPTANPTAIVTAYPTAEPTAEPTPDNDYTDIEGRLEDNEEDIGREGILRVYNSSDPAVVTAVKDGNFSAITPLKEISTDPYGYFSMTLDQLNSELPDGIVLRAKIGGAEQTSYVRTISLPSGDQPNVLMRAVPYPTFDINNDGAINQGDHEKFWQHFAEVDGTYYKWDLNSLTKIKIFRGDGDTSWDETGINNIITKIIDPDNIEQFFDGKELDDLIEVVYGFPETFYEYGCIQVVPNNNISGGVGQHFRSFASDGRTIISGRIELNCCAVGEGNPTLPHEFGHVSGQGGHSTASDNWTIMNAYPNGEKPEKADKKSAKIVNENTFPAGDYNWTRVMNGMLGMSW